jgi:hypothetical protein
MCYYSKGAALYKGKSTANILTRLWVILVQNVRIRGPSGQATLAVDGSTPLSVFRSMVCVYWLCKLLIIHRYC